MKPSIQKGAAAGLLAWLAYGTVEFAFSCALPAVTKSEVVVLAWQWPWIFLLLAAYAICGLLLGAAGSAALALNADAPDWKSYELMAALTLVLVFAANLLTAWPLARSEQIALAVACGLAALLIAGLRGNPWQQRIAFLGNGWVVSLLLLIAPWVGREALKNDSAGAKTGVTLGALAAIAGLAALAQRMRRGTDTRPRRTFFATASVLAAACILTLVAGRAPLAQAAGVVGNSARPNIVLITMDTVRADHLSLYGYERKTSPHLDQFASQATVYTRAIAASDMTLASHASMFTGLYSSWHGANTSHPDYRYGRPLPPEALTLAEILRDHGYWTAAVVANHSFLQAPMGLGQGFVVWDHHMPVHLSADREPYYLREGVRRLLSLVMSTADFDAYFLRSADINGRAFSLLDTARNRGPFFLFLNYMDSHIPYLPPPPYRDQFPGRDFRFRPAAEHQELTNAINSGKRHVTESQRRHLVSQYDAGIAYADAEIGELLARLKEAGLYENTLILVTADHGESFGEHDLMQHGTGSLYQDQVHVPLLVKYPGQHDGQRSSDLAGHVDVMPTVLELAGIAPPAKIQGRSLRIPRTGEDVIFSEATSIGTQDANPRLRGTRRALYAGEWKLIAWTAGPPELYNLATDPAESKNLYRIGDPRSDELMQRISTWIVSIPRTAARPVKVDKSTLDRIRGLGYTQ